MDVDAAQVIDQLLDRIRHLELELAVARAQLITVGQTVETGTNTGGD